MRRATLLLNLRGAAFVAAFTFLLPVPATAQVTATGRITGRVIDDRTGRPVELAQVAVNRTSITARTDLDGRYFLANVPVGTQVIEVRLIGYAAKTVSAVRVRGGETTVLDVTMTPAVFAVEEIRVTAEVERGSVASALQEQRTATNIVNAIGRDQIARSPDSDASQAVRRVSGVTVQDGRFVFVRGLGERYTTTSLNGARLPSPEPERRAVPLDLFPTGLFESISTSKTFTADQPGDFSGAQVNLRTRDFPGRRQLSISTSASFNDRVTGTELLEAPTVGREWLGFAGTERSLPAPAAAAGTSLADETRADANAIIASFRNAWSPSPGRGSPGGSFGLSLGGEDDVLGLPLGYIGTFSYGYSQELRENETKALARTGTDGTRPLNQMSGGTGTVSARWGGLVNLTARLGNVSKISVNNQYNRSADNTAGRWLQDNEEFGEMFEVTRLTFVERTVRSHQLLGEHLLGNRHKWEWHGSLASVQRDEPDRADLVYETEDQDGTPVASRWWEGSKRPATRTFSTLEESAYETGSNVRFALGAPGREWGIKVGGSYRRVERDADSRAFDITNLDLTEDERTAAPEEIFDGGHARNGRLNLFINANGGIYTATDRHAAGFVQLEIPLGRRVRVISGVRVEHADMNVSSLLPTSGTPVEAALTDTDFLPALTVNVALSDRSSLRVSGTQTLARPEYRELSPTSSFDVLGGLTLRGNPDLTRSLIQNIDLRWEYFPTGGEVVSVSVFGKHFDDPIERVLIGTTGTPEASYVNAAGAVNYGVELELRKTLAFLSESLLPFTIFTNVTLMQSDIEAAEGTALTNDSRPMVGQAEYVVNGGLGYSSFGGAVAATLLYNVVGPRITEAGVVPHPDSYEQVRHMIDASLRWQMTQQVGLRLDAKNVLDEPYRVVQGDVVRHEYWTGRGFAVGLTWRPWY